MAREKKKVWKRQMSEAWLAKLQHARSCRKPEEIKATAKAYRRAAALGVFLHLSAHRSATPTEVLIGGRPLRRADEYGWMWRCYICGGWRRLPTRWALSRCSVCEIAAPATMLLLDTPVRDHDELVREVREHAVAYWSACRPFAREFSRHWEAGRQTDVSLREIGCALARDKLERVTTPETEWFTQVFWRGERYVGYSTVDCSTGTPWRDALGKK